MTTKEDIKTIRKFIKFAKKTTWLLPITLIPAGFIVYFAESQNLPQLLSILAFAIILFYGLRWMLKVADSWLK